MSKNTENKEKEPESVLYNSANFERYSVVVDPNQEALRIDKFLMLRMEKVTRNKIQQGIKAGCLKVNGEYVKANYKVKGGDHIRVLMAEEPRKLELIAEDIPLNIVYEDHSVLVVNKEAGMVVHPGTGNYRGTLANAVSYHVQNLPNSKDYDNRPGLVHRLDKLTSGIMVVAKTEFAMTFLARQFFDRTVNRRYLALVWGDLEEDGTITGNIARDLKHRKKMAVFAEEDGIGKHAVTHYEVVKRFGYVTLVRCKLETGRTHQIRVHFKHIGCPLFGDPTYGGDRVVKGTVFTKYKQFVNNCFEILPRQALHAKKLGFTHPESLDFIQFNSELPDDFQKVLDKWEKYTNGRL